MIVLDYLFALTFKDTTARRAEYNNSRPRGVDSFTEAIDVGCDAVSALNIGLVHVTVM